MSFGAQELEFCRSLLFVPVPETRFVDRAHERGAGAVILDLEDGVAPEMKAQARGAVREVAATLRSRGMTVLVRINHGSREDVEAAVSPDVAALVLPKIDSAAEIQGIADLLDRREAKLGLDAAHTALLVLIETPKAVCNAGAIAACHPRVAGLVLGSEDLALALSRARPARCRWACRVRWPPSRRRSASPRRWRPRAASAWRARSAFIRHRSPWCASTSLSIRGTWPKPRASWPHSPKRRKPARGP
jgi:citrate lyase beta subunit